MLERVKARWFGTVPPDRGERLPVATITELTMLCDLAPPCCGHVALCDGACRDARPDMSGHDNPHIWPHIWPPITPSVRDSSR